MFSEDDIKRISRLIFESLVEHYDKLAEDENNKDYVLDHEDIIRNAVTEEDYKKVITKSVTIGNYI